MPQYSALALNRHSLSPQLYYASVKRTKCITIDVSLVAEAEKAAEKLKERWHVEDLFSYMAGLPQTWR